MIRSFSYSFVGLMAVVFTFLLLDTFVFSGGVSAKPQRVKADFQSISEALKSYRDTKGNYPTTDQGIKELFERPEILSGGRNQFTTQVPTDPWKNEYRYRRLPDDVPRGFEVRSVGPDGIEGNEDDRSSFDR